MKPHNSPNIRRTALVAALIISLGGLVRAQSWDLADDYSTTVNPNGAWSFGFSQAVPPLQPPTTFTLYDNVGPYTNTSGSLFPDMIHWHDQGPLPAVFKNVGLVPLTIETVLTVQPSVVFFHPGSDNAHSIVRWTAPQDGLYDVQGIFSIFDGNPHDVKVHVLENGTEVFTQLLVSGGVETTTYADVLSLSTGDELEFTLGFGSANYLDDSTGLDLTITRVSGTWTDLGHGLPGTAGAPSLTGTGSLIGGQPVSLILVNAAPSAPAWLIAGFTQLLAPFKGGVLVPNPDMFFGNLAVTGAGDLTLASTWPPGLPSGTSTYWQYWISDTGGPAGFAASNGLSSTTP